MHTKMKISNSFLCLVFLLSTFTTFASTASMEIEAPDTVSSKIESYLSTIDFNSDEELVTIFSNFLINENGDLYTVDFMITENEEIVVLSMDYEEEYYKVDSYSTRNMVQYSFPVAHVNSELVKIQDPISLNNHGNIEFKVVLASHVRLLRE